MSFKAAQWKTLQIMFSCRILGSLAVTHNLYSVRVFRPTQYYPVRFKFTPERARVVQIRNSLYVPRLLSRVVFLTALYLPLVVLLPIYYMYAKRTPNYSLWWVKWFVWTLEISGPTFTKFGQWASSRSDLFPREILNCFTRLQSHVSPHSIRYTKRVFREAFGKELDECFEAFEQLPIGVGAVAQVYRARLVGGKQVAVKVKHPNIGNLVQIDLQLMAFGAYVIELIVPNSEWLALSDEVATFSKMMNGQLDLKEEARNLLQFHRDFKEWGTVGFPKPVLAYTKRDFLTETWVDGVLLEKFLALGPANCDKELADIGLTSFLKMLILDNHLHADLHPGNILVSFITKQRWFESSTFIPTNELDELKNIQSHEEWNIAMDKILKDYEPYLYYVDAGLCSELSPKNWSNFIDLFRAVTDFDGPLISKLMVERSKHPDSVINFGEFSLKLTEFIKGVKKSVLTLNKFNVSEILMFMMNTVREYHVKIDGDFANLVVAIFIVEGIGKRLEPEQDLLRASVPFLKQAVRLRLKGNVSHTEDTLKSLIYEYSGHLLRKITGCSDL